MIFNFLPGGEGGRGLTIESSHAVGPIANAPLPPDATVQKVMCPSKQGAFLRTFGLPTKVQTTH